MYKIPANTLFLGKNLIILPDCPSTNTAALEMTQKGKLVEGTTVITDNQTTGRGQRGNSWESAPGLNLTFSTILTPGFIRPHEQFILSQAVSLGIRDALAAALEERGTSNRAGKVPSELSQPRTRTITIKWPNDVMINTAKAAGILIENQLKGSSIQYAVAGIGINLNQRSFTDPRATSLALETGLEFAKEEIFESVLKSIELKYMQLRSGETKAIREEYRASLYRRGEEHLFRADGTHFKGTIADVDVAGKLQVNVDGAMKTFDFKEITYVN